MVGVLRIRPMDTIPLVRLPTLQLSITLIQLGKGLSLRTEVSFDYPHRLLAGYLKHRIYPRPSRRRLARSNLLVATDTTS